MMKHCMNCSAHEIYFIMGKDPMNFKNNCFKDAYVLCEKCFHLIYNESKNMEDFKERLEHSYLINIPVL
jgi:hypothetical protein